MTEPNSMVNLNKREIAVFNQVVSVALGGKRCPTKAELHSGLTSRLAYKGYLRIEVGARNYRVITILFGPMRGLSTFRPEGFNPHMIVDAGGIRRIGEKPKAVITNIERRGPPSAPRPLTREELER